MDTRTLWICTLGLAITGCGHAADAASAAAEATQGQPGAPPPTAAPQAPSRCGDDVTVVDWWPGEYPSPVLQVLAPVRLPARAAVCDPTPTLTCPLVPGLVHPWVPDSSVRFRSIQPVARYELLQALTLDPSVVEGEAGAVILPTGTVVEDRGYLAEGMCSLFAAGHEFPSECPGNDPDGGRYRKLGGGNTPIRQLVGVACGDGKLGWIEISDDLVQRDELTWGSIVGYGEVGPAADATP